jgi:hypothetical protein
MDVPAVDSLGNFPESPVKRKKSSSRVLDPPISSGAVLDPPISSGAGDIYEAFGQPEGSEEIKGNWEKLKDYYNPEKLKDYYNPIELFLPATKSFEKGIVHFNKGEYKSGTVEMGKTLGKGALLSLAGVCRIGVAVSIIGFGIGGALGGGIVGCIFVPVIGAVPGQAVGAIGGVIVGCIASALFVGLDTLFSSLAGTEDLNLESRAIAALAFAGAAVILIIAVIVFVIAVAIIAAAPKGGGGGGGGGIPIVPSSSMPVSMGGDPSRNADGGEG